MGDIEQIQTTWTMPDGWTITSDNGFVQVFDTESDIIAEAITQGSIVESIEEHLKAQETTAAYRIMMATLKRSTES